MYRPNKQYGRKSTLFIILMILLALMLAVFPALAQDNDDDDDDDNGGNGSSITCPVTVVFWQVNIEVWPLTSLMLGSQFYDQEELIDLLEADPHDDASIALAQELIAAKLNIANGADSQAISTVIMAADSLLAGFAGKLPYGVAEGSTIAQRMAPLITTVQVYNIGILIGGNCIADDDITITIPINPEVTPIITPDDDDDNGGEVTAEPTPAPEITPEVTLVVTPAPDDDDDDDDDNGGSDGAVIVIEGPVTNIDLTINVITIFDFDIVVQPGNPIIQVIQIGDIIQVIGQIPNPGDVVIVFPGPGSGNDDDDDDDDDDDNGRGGSGNITIVIIAIQITVINVEVVVNVDGQVWRDPGTCQNAPPAWAPALGWRARCQGGNIGPNRPGPGRFQPMQPGAPGGGPGRPGGGANDDDDDDD